MINPGHRENPKMMLVLRCRVHGIRSRQCLSDKMGKRREERDRRNEIDEL